MEVSDMLVKLFVLWVLMSLFCGSRAAGSTVRFLFGITVFFWVMRIIAGFGLILLPVVLLVDGKTSYEVFLRTIFFPSTSANSKSVSFARLIRSVSSTFLSRVQ